MPVYEKSLVWFRRDLRDFDHAALRHALQQSRQVYCTFIFDKSILDDLPETDRRVAFIHGSIEELDAGLRRLGGGLIVRHADAAAEIPALAEKLGVDAVFANHDYEPYAVARDAAVAEALRKAGREWRSFKDQVVFEKNEVLALTGKPFSVFTPYKKAWLRMLHAAGAETVLQPWEVEQFAAGLVPSPPAFAAIPDLQAIGFRAPGPASAAAPGFEAGMSGGLQLLERFSARLAGYGTQRDFPAADGTSMLSVHLRFGTVSIRMLARRALEAMRSGQGADGAEVWLSELIWRDFYFMILHHHPRVAERAFKPEYDRIVWESGAKADENFDAWRGGRTGFPLVDAAMLQLERTGFMHNRLRMVSASFLCKDLGIDWRRGERHFSERLNDYDLAANNGGWQWAASSGCDAQPYFRIFNPVTQSQRFDPEGKFIRRFLPQLARLPDKHIHAPWLAPADVLRAAGVTLGVDYPQPVVQHDEARRRTLERYAVVRKSGGAEAAGMEEDDD